MPKISIGMAVHSDFDGVVFTIQGLRIYHHFKDVELIVVDNDPTSPDGLATKNFVEKLSGKWPARYIPFTNSKGTAATRDLVFKEATGEIVMCIDSHVLLSPGALYYLLSFYDQFPNSMDLVQGPLMYEDPAGFSTHFQDIWQAEMWGVWGTDRRGEHRDNPPFEIPGQGLGLFACRKEAWLGFNPHFRGFGGEEMYIHEKFRQAGRKTWCLPGLRWWHRFGRPRGVNYPLTKEDKLRNYILGHLELKLNLDRVHNHFVNEVKLPQETYDRLLAEAQQLQAQPPVSTSTELVPVEGSEPVVKKKCNCGKTAPSGAVSIDQAVQAVHTNKKDSGSDYFSKYFANAANVVEVVDRRTRLHAIILASKPKNIFSISPNTPPEQNKAEFNFQDTKVRLFADIASAKDILPKEADVLVIHYEPGIEETLKQLDNLTFTTAIFAASQEDVAKFVETHGVEWAVIDMLDGAFVLRKYANEDKQLPNLLTRAGNFVKAVVKHAKNNFGNAPPELVEKRHSLCMVCPERNNDHCSKCGCPVKEKVTWESETCPLNKW